MRFMNKGLLIFDAAQNSSFGSGLTANNEVHRRIYYIIDDIFVFLYHCLSELCIEALIGYKNMTRYGNFPGYGRLVIK